jgi:hypothetical protein
VPKGQSTPFAQIRADPEKAYLLWRAAMTGRTDEFEARLTRLWRRQRRRFREDGEMVRRALLAKERAMRRGVAAGFVKPSFGAVEPFRQTVDKTLAGWIDKEFRRLRLFPSRRKRGAVEVFNRLWDTTKGGPKTIIEMAHDAARRGAVEASGPLSRYAAEAINKRAARRLKNRIRHAAEKAPMGGHQQSWADNIVRALEQSKHQANMGFVDATSGLNPMSAVHEAITKFAPPLSILYLSYTTHPRAAYRSTMAAAGEAAEADSYVYYLPAGARAAAKPEGFGAEHYAQVRTVRQWEALRRKMKRKRPGSYIFTTGFHVGDRGYLLPVPALLLAAAREIERRRRQAWLEGIRERGGAA